LTYIDYLNHFSKQSFISNFNIHVSPFFRSSGPILLSSKFRFFIWLLNYRAIVLKDLLFGQKVDWLIIEHLNLAVLKKVISLLIHWLRTYSGGTPFDKRIVWWSSDHLLSLKLVVIGQFLRARSDVHNLHLLVYCILLSFITVLKISILIHNS